MAAITRDTLVGDLLKNPKALALAEQFKPGISGHPALFLAKGLTLQQVAALPQVNLSLEQLDEYIALANRLLEE